MSFDNLAPQSPINPRADVYGLCALKLSELAALKGRAVLDVPYGREPAQKLDIWLPPSGAPGDLPVFLNIHGGGWTHGYKEWMGFQAPALVDLPAIHISVEYRLAPAARFPASFEDCLAALKWTHEHIAEYGGSPDRLFIGGHSAGAHLSSLVTLRRDRLKAAGLPEDVVKGCFPFSGVYAYEVPGLDPKIARVTMMDQMIGPGGDARDASPLNFIAGNRVPFHVTWSENDNPFCKAHGPIFARALKDAGTPVVAHEFAGMDHFQIHLDMQRRENHWVRDLRAGMSGQGPS
jgi:acetyl esterase/lipase